MEKPSDLNKFYLELENEWKKYRTLRVEGVLFKDMETFVKDAGFSRDHFLMLEYPIPTENKNGYALVEVEKGDHIENLGEKAAKMLAEDESLKEILEDPKTLQFTTIPFSLVCDETSVRGACGLSNLGNT